jgi:hypothetical protein
LSKFYSQLTFVLKTSPLRSRYTVWPEPIWIKVNSSWLLLPQHQSTYLRGSESASIEIPPFRPQFIKFSKTVFYEVNLVSQRSHLEVLLVSEFGSEREDFNWCSFWASWVHIYFDAVVLEVEKNLLLFRLALAILWLACRLLVYVWNVYLHT